MNASIPTWWGVAASALLVVAALVVSMREQLGLTREIAVAAVRAIVQLIAVGALLGILFLHTGLAGSLLWVVGMVAVGSQVAGRRGKGIPRARPVAAIAIAVGVTATLGLLVVAQVIDAEPRVVVPVGGMVVSAATRGTSAVLLRMQQESVTGRRAIEARLALGLPAAQAFAPHRRVALQSALVTDVDTVRTVGLISLPGAMTGLLLAGVDPLTAIRYQVVVMYMLLGAVAISTAVAARLATHELFDDAQRLQEVA